MAFGTFPATVVANSQPLTLAQGFSLWPTVIPKPTSALAQWSGKFFELNAKVLGVGLAASAGYEVFFGVLGPAWATQVTVDGSWRLLDETRNGQPLTRVEFNTRNDQLIAGLVLGASATLKLSGSANIIFKQFEVNFNITFDLINICLTIISKALGAKSFLTKVLDKLPSIPASWGAFDSTTDSYATSGGTLEVRPKFEIPINIYSLLVLADTTTGIFSGVMVAADKVVTATLSSITVGPTIGMGVRVQVRVTALVIESVDQNGTPFPPVVTDGVSASPGRLSGVGIGRVANPTRVGMNFSQSPFFDLTLGFIGQIQIFQIFNLGGSVSFSILDALKLKIPLGGPFPAELRNNVGRQTVSLREVEFV